MALRISRRWSQEPDWFQNLRSEQQTDLLAEYIVDNLSSKEQEKRKEQYNRMIVERLRNG